jgi:hypothetical protein
LVSLTGMVWKLPSATGILMKWGLGDAISFLCFLIL